MKHISESIIGKKGSRLSHLSRRKAIEYAKDYMTEYPDHEDDEFEDQYEAAGEALYYLSGCSDNEISEIADTALDSDSEGYDRFEIFMDAINAISKLK